MVSLLFGRGVYLYFSLVSPSNDAQQVSWETRSVLLGAEYLLGFPGEVRPQILLR